MELPRTHLCLRRGRPTALPVLAVLQVTMESAGKSFQLAIPAPGIRFTNYGVTPVQAEQKQVTLLVGVEGHGWGSQVRC